ncbi:MAG: valyl-tRNA synthetase [Candidatus Peribacter riflensis]|uniref:Valine--tRNA ligase n=1 Tax=Candidatus Peribacter riflensis TaxID=1735162 RepID=A0A0S1SUN9_9BACT|nr:MAG: valyl-tRNA synthetase [Candidatus Peribacter riflensis]OGJ77805.1 MAG: valine--tRNA ligase [Candidatus Peribacteria bacterium RIFOXYB1_FULL_57_12]ALM11219.1 MAG: valyl-tRNA synthetase [Candidatus Peribacter riflensis]ALM12322.1 MAG: valyl-tRNA synthetase [Candidatus Peribacter riflensis]ALM13424.1 MAG: valyl-tRNA synthetase [Candidatus Peribacter riflensis]
MLPKAYDPKACEDQIYTLWEQSGAFKADSASKKEPFVISMPPPNATGQLHLGHAVMLALEDIFTRFARMQGKEALWLPGTDHAAIATESVVIKKIQKEEKIKDPRAHYGREKLVAKIAEFVDVSRGTIRSQVRKMGSSCDWSRERYTLDASLNRCVNEVFKKMYGDGLIYRGQRIVNWDPKMQTTVSDDEIEYVEEKAPFYTFQYGPFQISTARPETKFGDKYVVMHPDDERYKQYKDGDTFTAEWINGPVQATVIKDSEAIDPTFGTGVMTITPWHDMTDFELAERHGLTREQIIDFEGKLLPVAGEFAGLPIEEARPKVVEKLKEKGLLVKVDENYVHRVAVSYRGKGVVEPQIKEQWFIDVNKPVVEWKKKKLSLKQVMQDVIRSKDIRIIPERFEKIYFHWIDNLRDWCVSRQIWWGHRIPVYYCQQCMAGESGGAMNKELGIKNKENGKPHNSSFRIPNSGGLAMTVSAHLISQCPHCGGVVEQDPDTLDTWFSSGLWTWSTLIDPALAADTSLSLKDLLDKSPDFQKFHPTTVMETGYDILFFWVARMILMTTYATGQIPFKHVYLHGLVRTRDGKKMSKSDPATCIDPLEIIPKYGADALRLSMIVGQSPGNDFRLYEEKIAGYRNFINKLWNASRFVLMQCEKAGVDPKGVGKGLVLGNLSVADCALLSSLQGLIEDVTQGLKEYRLSEAGERLYSFVWDYFCDWYLELSKGESNPAVLVHGLRTIVHLLHPYCPFVTEELWSQIAPKGSGPLIREPWPTVEKKLMDHEAEEQLQLLIDVISSIRSLRAEYGVAPEAKIPVTVHAVKSGEFLSRHQAHVLRLANVSELLVVSRAPAHRHGVVSMFLKGVDIHLLLEGVVDLVKVKGNLEAERAQLQKFLAGVRAKLTNEQFMARAKPEVIETEKQKLQDGEEKLKKIEERLKALS